MLLCRPRHLSFPGRRGIRTQCSHIAWAEEYPGTLNLGGLGIVRWAGLHFTVLAGEEGSFSGSHLVQHSASVYFFYNFILLFNHYSKCTTHMAGCDYATVEVRDNLYRPALDDPMWVGTN